MDLGAADDGIRVLGLVERPDLLALNLAGHGDFPILRVHGGVQEPRAAHQEAAVGLVGVLGALVPTVQGSLQHLDLRGIGAVGGLDDGSTQEHGAALVCFGMGAEVGKGGLALGGLPDLLGERTGGAAGQGGQG